MEDEQYHKIQRILKLTLEFICLLTGEECIIVRKSPCAHRRSDHSKSPIMEPSSSSTMLNSDEKILQLIKKITELLTGEVPIRCQDVTVYFSMEEWEYLEGHKDLYKDVMMEKRPLPRSPGGSRKRNPPQRFPRPQDSTQEHQEIPHAHSLSSQDSTQKLHEIPQVYPLYSQNCTEEHHEILQVCPLYSQNSTQEHHQIPHTHSLYHQESTEKPNEIPQACPLCSQNSTQKHHKNPQVHPLYSQESTQEHHEILQAHHQFSRRSTHSSEKDGANERNPPEKGPPPQDSTKEREIPQTCLQYFRVSTQGHHTTPQKKVINQRTAACAPETTNYDSREKSLEVPLTEATEQNRNSKAKEHHGSKTSNQTKANLDMDIPPKTCRDYTFHGSLKDTNNVFNPKSGNEDKHKNFSAVVSQSSITSKQTEPDDIAFNLNKESTISSKPIEPDPVAWNLTKKTTISSKQTELDTVSWNHTKEATISLKQTEPDAVTGNLITEVTNSSKHTEPDTVTWNLTKEATISSKQTEPDTVAWNLTKKATMTSKQTEPDTVAWNLTKETTISPKQIEPDAIAGNLTKEATISSKQTKSDTVTWNLTKEATISSQPTEPDTVACNLTKKATISSKQTEPDSVACNLTKKATISSKQTEPDTVACNLTKKATISSKQTGPDTVAWNLTKEATFSLKQTEPDAITENLTKEATIFLKQTKPDTVTWNLTKEATISSQPTEPDTVACNLTKKATISSKQTEPDIVACNLTKKATISSKQTGPDTVAWNLTKEATFSLKQTEPDAIAVNLTKEATISAKQTKPDPDAWNHTKEAVISSKQTEPDNISWNLTKESTICLKSIEANTVNENPTEADSTLDRRVFRDDTLTPPLKINNPNALVCPTTVGSNQAEADSITLQLMENATVSSKQTESTTIISTPTKSVDVPLRAFRHDKLPPHLQIRNASIVACEATITSNQAEADSMTLHLTKEATVPLKQFETSAMSLNPTDTDPAVDNPQKTMRDHTLTPLLKNRNPSAMVCQATINSNPTEAGSANPSKALRDDTLSPPLHIRNTKVMVCQTPTTSNQKEDSGVVIPTDVCKDDTLVPPLQDANNIFNSEAAKKTTVEDTAAEANPAVDTLTTTCQDGKLQDDTNILSHSKARKNKSMRKSKSVIGHGTNAFKKTEADLDGDKHTRVFRDHTLPAPLRDTDNISDKTGQIAVNSSTALVDHRATKENQTIADSAVDNTTTKDYALRGLLKTTNNASNFAPRKNTNIKHSEAVTSHDMINSTNIEVNKAIKIPTASSTDNKPSAPILDNNNSKTGEDVKDQNTSGVVNHGRITTNQTKVLNNPTATCPDDSLPVSLKEINSISRSNATKNKILRNFRSVDGQSLISLNQTEANSAVATPARTLRGDTHLAPVRTTHNTFKSLKTLRITITNSTASVVTQVNQTKAVDNPTPPAYWDGNNFSNFEAIKNKQIEDSEAGHGTTISENMKVMSALNYSTSTSKDDPPTVASKDANNVSDCETRASIIKKSNVGGHSHVTTNQSKANSTSNDSTPVWMDDRSHTLLKDANGKAITKIRIPATVSHNTILSSQTENLQSLALNNPTRASKIDALPAPLKDTNNTIGSEEMEDKNMTNSKSGSGQHTTASNQIKGDSAVDKPKTCGEDLHISPVESKNISNSEGTKKNELNNLRSVIVYSAIVSNRTDNDSLVENSSEAHKDNTLPVSLKDTNYLANYVETKKNSNPKSVIVYSTISSTKVDFALSKPAETSRDNTNIASLHDADNVSNPVGERNRNSTSVFGCGPIATIQTEVSSVLDDPTEACGNNTLSNTSMKDPNNVSSYKATKKSNNHNSSDVLGYSSIPTNQTETNSKNTTTSCRGEPNSAPNYIVTRRRKIQSSCNVVGHSPINTNQTEANSASNNPTTTCLDEIIPFPLEGTNNASKAAMKKSIAVIGYSTIKSNQIKLNMTLNNPTTENVPNLEAYKNLKNLSVTASSAIISNQAKDGGVVDNSTFCKEDSCNALVKNTKQVSNDEETKKNKQENSVIVYSTTTSNQSEAGTALTEPATSFKDNKMSSPCKNINIVTTSDMKNDENITNSTYVMGHDGSNQPVVNTVVDKPTGSYMDNTAPAIVNDTDNASNSKLNKKGKIKKRKSVGSHSALTFNQSKGGPSQDKLPCKKYSHIAPLRDSKSISNSEQAKKVKTRNSRSVMVHSDQTEANLALNKPAATFRDQTPSPTENETNNVSKLVRKTRRCTYVVGCDTITPVQTQVDNKPPSSLTVPNNVSNSKAPKKRQMMISNATVGHSTTTSNQTQEGSALDNTTECSEDSHFAPLKDTNNISSSEEINQINAGPVYGHEAMSSNKTEDFSLNYSTKAHIPPPPLEEENVSKRDWTEGENVTNPAAVVGNSTITSSDAETNPAIAEPATVLNGTNNTELNTKATEMKNAEERDGYITLYLLEVSPFLDDPSINHTESQAPVVLSLDDQSIDHNNESQALVVLSLDDQSIDQNNESQALVLSLDDQSIDQNNESKVLVLSLDDQSIDHNNESQTPVVSSDSNVPGVRKKRKLARNYKCSECEKTFLSNAHLVVHLQSHTGERPFLCPECGKGFASKPWLVAHQVKHHESHRVVRRHLCSYCGRTFIQSSHLREHLKQHTEERYSCIKCRKKFQTESALFSHYKIHQITPISCPECSKRFTNRVSFERHQRIHTGHKLFTCSECGRCFVKKTQLSIHFRTHSGEKPFMCPVCKRRFTGKSACNKHISRHTADKHKSVPAQAGPDIATRQFSCPTVEILTKHRQSHSKEEPFPCRDCGQRFATEALLVAHKCQPEKNCFSCPKCDTGFRTQLELEMHQKNHTEEKFACNSCDRCFTDKMLLAIHKLKHLGNKLFSCEKCKKGFRTQMELDAHVENHPELNQKHLGEEENMSSNNTNKGLKTPQELDVHQQNHLEKESFSGGDCSQCFDSEAHEKHDLGKSCFSCTKCNIGFATQSELETHEKNHPEKGFLCGDCNRRFTCKTLLVKHLKKHCGNKRFSCEKCKKGCRTLRELEEHEKNHLKLNQTPHPTEKQLSSSDKDIKMQEELEGDQQSHVQRKPFRCSICGHHFSDQTRLEEHQKKHTEKQFTCLLCKKCFKTQPELKTHQKNQCDEKPFICGDCGRRFASEALLAEHQERHVGKKRYTCLECGYGFNEKSNFEKHCRTHTGERPYPCPHCDKAFAVKSNMIRHSKIHTGDRPYKCLECSKSFRGKSYLIAHQLSHMRVQEYPCSQCSKTFQFKSNYDRHFKSHIEKKFPCTQCSKSFSSPTQLAIHARTHSRQKFECPLCGKNFRNNWALNKHSKIHTRQR